MEQYKWEVGRTYSTEEMKTLMGIKQSTWSHQKDKYLSNFSLYYEYEVIYEGRKTNYLIIKQLGDYQKPPSKRDKTLRDKTYQSSIIGVIEEAPVQTAKSVSRIIKDDEPIKAFNHSDGTCYEYTRLNMREMFGKKINSGGSHGEILDKTWCRLDAETNLYVPMSDSFVKAFREMFSSNRKEADKDDLEAYNDYKIGLITKEELKEIVGVNGLTAYLTAQGTFYQKYGFHPIKVPRYGFYDIDILNFDRKEVA